MRALLAFLCGLIAGFFVLAGTGEAPWSKVLVSSVLTVVMTTVGVRIILGEFEKHKERAIQDALLNRKQEG